MRLYRILIKKTEDSGIQIVEPHAVDIEENVVEKINVDNGDLSVVCFSTEDKQIVVLTKSWEAIRGFEHGLKYGFSIMTDYESLFKVPEDVQVNE